MLAEKTDSERSGQETPKTDSKSMAELSARLYKIQFDTLTAVGGAIQAAKDSRIVFLQTQALAEKFISEGNNDAAIAVLTLRRSIVSKILE